MANDIIFIRGEGGLGRALDGKDHYSGVVFALTNSTLTAISIADKEIRTFYSTQDVDDLGITYGASLEGDLVKYYLESIFQQNDKAVVFVQFNDAATVGFSFETALKELQSSTGGEIRQSLVVDHTNTFATANLTPLQAAADTMEAEHSPMSIFYTCNLFEEDLSALPNLKALGSKNVSVIIGQDLGGKGGELMGNWDTSASCAGAFLGAISKAKVNENVAWIGEFNINSNDSNEFDSLAIGDLSNTYRSLATSFLDALEDKGYIYLKKHVGKAGSYFNDTFTCILETSDYSFVENNRTIDKAVRNVRVGLIDKLNSPLFVNEDGTLTEDVIADFKNDAERPLIEMLRNEEISAQSVIINPAQDVLSSSKITIAISIVPAGVARNIVVNIGLTVRV